VTSISQRVVVLIGCAIAAIGLHGIVHPEQLAMVRGWPPHLLWAVAVGVRVVLGVFFLIAAPRCRFPGFVGAVGLLALAAAAGLLVVGPGRLEALVDWWFRQSPQTLRAVYVADVVFGVVLVYAGSRRPAS
jgi:hypothetical protein